jgi:hypothetical protein
MEEFNEQEFEQLTADIDLAFPNCPFTISCVNKIEELDNIFTQEKVIIIKDDRANYWHWWFDDITEEETKEYINYTVVKAPYNGNITLRTIIQAMINDQHYHNDLVLRDSHHFLESIDKQNDQSIEYISYWGS